VTRLRKAAALLLTAAVIAPVTPAAAAESCRRDPSWAEMRPAWATEVLTLTNAHRASMGLAPLAPSASLTDAATWKAAHMAGYGYMTHDDPAPPIGRTWDQRIRDCGYSSGAGENIAYGYRSPQAVFDGWLDSAGHRRNIENPSYKVIGVGAALSSEGTPYWTQVFGLRVQLGDAIDVPELPAPTPTPPPPPPPPPPSPVPTDAPSGTAVVRDDSVTVPEDTSARVAPLLNDSGIAQVVALGEPQHGAVTLGPGDEVVYVPDHDFHGADSFTYSALGVPTAGVVTVTVEPRNDAPSGGDDVASARPRRSVTVDVLANDADPDGDRLRVKAIVRAPYYGSAVVDGDEVVYRARRGTGGRSDRLTYRVSDGAGGSDLVTVEVRIRR
jgi:uncharacterized protein YkwD